MPVWASDVRAGDWLVERMVDVAGDVGSVVPRGFEAYARVLHPLEDGPERRWTDLAARNGRIAHPEMQLHLVASRPGETPDGHLPLAGVSVGSLPPEETTALAAILAVHTATPDRCWFAVWDGDADPVRPPGPRLELPGRSYALLRGVVADVVGLGRAQSPNLWWPDDRAWCVATEIDLAWTYVGGTAAAVEDVLADPALEALPARVTDAVTVDGDLLNEALDGRS